MKTIYNLVFLSIVLSIITNAVEGQTISSNITVSNPTFLQGLTGVYDTLTVSGIPGAAVTTNFVIFNANGDSINVIPAINISTCVPDMGLMDTSAVAIHAVFYDTNNYYLDTSYNYQFSIKPLPSWANKPDSANNGQITLQSFQSSGIAQITGILPLYQKMMTMPDDVWGVGGKQFGINRNNIRFQGSYDVNGGVGTVNGNKTYNFQLSAFELNYPDPPYNFNLDSLPNSSIDIQFDPGNNLELIMDAKYSNSMNLVRFKSREWKMRLPPPLSLLTIGIGVGFNLDGGFGVRALMGQEGGKYGFVGDINTDSVSSVTVGGKITGTVWGNINLISKKLGGIEGELWLTGDLGAQYRFKSVPAFQDTLVWGGDLQLGGKLRLTGMGGRFTCSLLNAFSDVCGEHGEILSGNIWPTGSPYPINGGLPSGLAFGALIAQSTNPYTRSLTYQNDFMDDGLKNLSQQSFITKGDKIGVVWIEEDSLSQHLAFSEKGGNQHAFRQALLVNDTIHGICHPKVGLTGNGSAIIVWAQNKLTVNDITSNTSVNDIIDAQDIWFAIYDSTADSIVYRSQVYEQTDLSDGMPNVTISDSDKAIITWLAEDTTTGHTDIWETEITNQNGVWYQSNPVQLTTADGNNFSVQVTFIDSSKAIATWINDPDGDDSVPGNSIMYALYDGANWNTPTPITSADNSISYQELAMDFNGGYGALAYTYTDYSDTVNMQNKFSVEVYDVNSQNWLTNSEYDYEDSLHDVKMPRISISKDGIAVASFQTIALQTDTNEDPNHGNINLIARNLASDTGWTVIQNSQLISDSSVLTWDMDLTFGANNTLYTLSHEIDTIAGNTYYPRTGVLFGNPDISLVLRGLQFTNNLGVDSLAQDSLPETPTGITPLTESSKGTLRLKVYPNPLTTLATIEFFIPETGQARLEVFNLFGESISLPVNLILGQGSYTTVIESLNLASGIYIVRLTAGTQSKFCKLVRQ